MAHGYPDWGVMSSKEVIYGLSDLGEVVARLGGIITYDRAGDLIWFDSFEHGWSNLGFALSGTSSSIALTTSRFRSNGYCIALQPGTGVAPTVQVSKDLPILGATRLGYEASFTLHDSISYVELLLWWYSGAQRYSAVVRVKHPAGTIVYVDENGVEQTLASGLQFRATGRMFHTAKLVIDLTTFKYARFRLDSLSYDLSTFNLRSSTNTTAPYITPRFLIYGDGANNPTLYLDDVIITQNEP